MKPPIEFHWKGNHHSYYGFFLIAFGIFNSYMGEGNGNLESIMWIWYSFIGVGSFMIIDDIIEHKVTASTPLRILYEKLFGLK